ncbi:MAG: DUF58 domain-containing protein [Oscillospiraceae bacterium]
MRYCSFTLRIVNLFTGESISYPMRYGLLDDSESMISLPTSSSGTLLCSLEDEELSSYLGLLKLRPKRQWQAKCTVMPKPKTPKNMASLESLPPVSQNYRPKPGGGYSRGGFELRQYRHGENINSIHWKLSSKTDELIVREPEPMESSTAVLLHTTGELDLSHLYWLSLRLCSWNIEHVYTLAAPLPWLATRPTAVGPCSSFLPCPGPSAPLSAAALAGSSTWKTGRCTGIEQIPQPPFHPVSDAHVGDPYRTPYNVQLFP